MLNSPSSNSRSLETFPIQFIKGVGPRIAEILAKKGILTPEDLLYYFPYKYLDRRRMTPIGELKGGGEAVAVGKIITAGIGFFGRGRRIFEVLLGDDSGVVSLKWFRFNPRQMMGSFKKGDVLLVAGMVTQFRKDVQMIHPTTQHLDSDVMADIRAPGLLPTYSAIPGLGQKTLQKIVRQILVQFAGKIEDPIPLEIRQKYEFLDKEETFHEIHFPSPEVDFDVLSRGRTPAMKREIFEEFFFMELGLALKRYHVKREAGHAFPCSATELEQLKQGLPFTLTRAQNQVMEEILADLAQPCPMNRLLQGDVGSGKTIIALLAARIVLDNGFQVALMAPTEILAEQHYQTARKILASANYPIALLTSRSSAAEMKQIRRLINRGIYRLVVGTHALLSEDVHFDKLGLALIDEQHRFGVVQRQTLKEKGRPDILVMTATPIPRTLSMTLYGDLDLSVIDELPPGRQRIKTLIFKDSERKRLYQAIGEITKRGEQVYVVYPLVEESEKLPLKDATRMSEELKLALPEVKIALLHGRVKEEERDQIMRGFKEGEIQLLVATTVVEVGIDVPNATLMVIENAERFGLSQLHQLRGRVGRGSKPSYCVLVSSAPEFEPAGKRLKVMTETGDGFRIAEEDLSIRGPGDYLGTRQSGLPELRVANLLRDFEILKLARQEAFKLVKLDPTLRHQPTLRSTLYSRWKERLALAEIA